MIEISKILKQLPDQVQSQTYDLLVTKFLGGASATQSTAFRSKTSKDEKIRTRKNSGKVGNAVTEKKALKRSRSSGHESYSIDRNLNLRGDKSMPSFKEFNDEKKPSSAKEFNAIAVYYLEKIAGLSPVTLDMAYTCYAEVSRKPPKAFRQSFIDTKNREGWVEFDDSGNLKIPHRGSVFVEHDLPGTAKSKKDVG